MSIVISAKWTEWTGEYYAIMISVRLCAPRSYAIKEARLGPLRVYAPTGIEPVISHRWVRCSTVGATTAVYIMAFIGLHILKGEVALHLWWICRTTSLLYLPSERSKTGGYTVFTFCVHTQSTLQQLCTLLQCDGGTKQRMQINIGLLSRCGWDHCSSLIHFSCQWRSTNVDERSKHVGLGRYMHSLSAF